MPTLELLKTTQPQLLTSGSGAQPPSMSKTAISAGGGGHEQFSSHEHAKRAHTDKNFPEIVKHLGDVTIDIRDK